MASTFLFGTRFRTPRGARRPLAGLLVLASLVALSCSDDDGSDDAALPPITLDLARVSGAGSEWQDVPPSAAISLDCARSLGVGVTIEVESAGQTFALRPPGFCASTARLCGRVLYELRDADEHVLASVEAASPTAFLDLAALSDATLAEASTLGARLLAANGSPVVLGDGSEVSDSTELTLSPATDCDAPPSSNGGAGSGGEGSQVGGESGSGGAGGATQLAEGGAAGTPSAGGAAGGGVPAAGGEGGAPATPGPDASAGGDAGATGE